MINKHTDAHQIVESAWTRFRKKLISDYRVGDRTLYNEERQIHGWHYSQNQHVKTEDDVKIQFGIHLHNEIAAGNINATVHSEMPIYTGAKSGGAVDLSVHWLSEPPLWINEGDARASLCAAIEIKYLTFLYPRFWIARNGIQKDIEKLHRLYTDDDEYRAKDIATYLILFDEANWISEHTGAEICALAKESGVVTLSNNRHLSTNGRAT